MQKKVTAYLFDTLSLHALKNAFRRAVNREVYIYARARARTESVNTSNNTFSFLQGLTLQKLASRMGAGVVVIGVVLLNTGVAWAITGQYNTAETDLKPGMAVAVSAKRPKVTDTTDSNKTTAYVEKSSMSRASQTIGVVVGSGQDTLSVVGGPPGAGLVYVASSGEVKVYVTDLNGEPKAGDLLAPSPLKGVLMRANNGATGIMGSLLADFPASTAMKIQVDGSEKTEVKIAVVAINMDVRTSSKSSGTLGLLQRIGQSIVGHSVSSAQVFIALTILALVIVAAGSILYATIRGYITSLGRNPLASRKLLSGLLQIAGLVAVVLTTGGIAIYLVLRI